MVMPPPCDTTTSQGGQNSKFKICFLLCLGVIMYGFLLHSWYVLKNYFGFFLFGVVVILIVHAIFQNLDK